MKTNVKTPDNVWKEYSDKQNADYLKLYKETNRIKADTQILVHKVEIELMKERPIQNGWSYTDSKAKELLKEITKINQL